MATPNFAELAERARRESAGTASPVDYAAMAAKARSEKPAEEEKTSSWLDSVKNLAQGFIPDTAAGIGHMVKRLALPPETNEDKAAFAIAGVAGPLLKDIIVSHYEAGKKAKEAFSRGSNLEGSGYAVATALPGLGPWAANIGETAGRGEFARAAGQLAGGLLLPKVIESIPNMRLPGMNPANPVEAAAVRSAAENGIPMSAGAATGNKFVKGVQALADHTPIGSMIAESAKAKQVAALGSRADALMEQVHPSAIVPEQAGRGVADTIEGKVSDAQSRANDAYSKAREIEAMPENLRKIQTGTKRTPVLNVQGNPIPGKFEEVPVFEDIAAPSDLRQAKVLLRPVLDQYKRQLPVTQQRASFGLKAIENIVDGPDFASVSQVDQDLSAIKALARGADLPELRNVSQGLAAHAVKTVEGALQKALADAPPELKTAINAGRKATMDKYEAADVLKSLPKAGMEGRQVFDQAVWAKDAGIEQLRRVQSQAPESIPKIGRALLEDMFNKATFEGGFDKIDGLLNRWRDLGPETKKVLYKNPALIRDLDSFFIQAKKASHDVNPSGSGHLVGMLTQLGYVFTDPVRGVPLVIGAGGLSKLLHSPAAVKVLTEGFRVPIGDAARAASVGTRLRAIAGEHAIPLDKVAAASQPQQEAETRQ